MPARRPGRVPAQADALLNTATLRRLRLQAGYSTRRFARALGVSASTVRGLEEGSNHDQLPLTFVVRLAELLGVAPRELFAHTASEAVDPSSDDRIVEAALQSIPGVVSISDLGSALKWKLERTRRALDVLEARLQSPVRGCIATAGNNARSGPPPSTSPTTSSKRCIASAHGTAV